MKIQLQSLRVVNCGPLRDDCIQFNAEGESPTTVLAGANGSGKTTILKLIVALAETLTYPSVDASDDEANTLDRADYAQANFLIDGTPLDLFSGYASFGDFHENYFGTSLSSRYVLDKPVRGRKRKQSNGDIPGELRSAITEQQESAALAHVSSENTVPSLLFFPHERGLIQTSGKSIRREEAQYEWVYKYRNVSTFANSLDSYLIWLEYSEPEVYAEIIDFLNSLNFDGKKFGVQRKELRAVVTARDGQTHGVAELSSGEQNILIMLLELRRRLLPYSIVLIDEIENSLHAAFQHRLGQALKKMQAVTPFQLIVTTHSSEFARIFGLESVRILTEF